MERRAQTHSLALIKPCALISAKPRQEGEEEERAGGEGWRRRGGGRGGLEEEEGWSEESGVWVRRRS